MASAAGPVMYWCHLCNVETQPAEGSDDDVLCRFCNQGFVEELHTTEVEPGVTFGALPHALTSFLRRPSPSSVGANGEGSGTDSSIPSSPLPTSSSSSASSSSLLSSSLPVQLPQEQSRPRNAPQTEPQGHRPRLLSGRQSGLPGFFEVMMQALEEMNGISPPANHHAPADVLATEGSTGNATVGPTHAQSTGANNPNSEAGGGQPPRRMPSRPGDMLSLIFPPTLILQGDLPGGLRTLEVYIDHGQGMGPQIMPNHVRDYFLGPDLDRLIQMLSENDQNRYGTPPAAKSEVEKLPKLKITEEHLGSELAQCAVCKDDFELDSEVIQLPCNHIYHPDCILPWLAEHNSCPVCRFELPTDDADYEARKGQNRSEATGTNTERQVADHMNSENSGSGDSQNVNNIELPANGEAASRQFTLWGMPALGFDLNRSSSRLNSTSNSSDSPAQAESTVQSRSESIPMHWLFRLFSSGDLQTPEEAISGNGNSEQSNPGDSSAS